MTRNAFVLLARLVAGLLVACGLSVVVAAPAAASAAGGRRWVAPVSPVVVRRPFEPPRTRWGPGHRGVDLATYDGAPVRAAGAGIVTYAGPLAGRGVLVVTHGTLRTTYEPVEPLATVGTFVGAGDVVAWLAAGHDGPALPGESLLHWGLLRGTTYLDPLSLLARGPSRLVPVAPAAPAPLAAGAAAPLPLPPEPPSPAPGHAAAAVVSLVSFAALVRASRAGRRASRAAAGRPSYASGRSGSPSHPAPGRSPPG